MARGKISLTYDKKTGKYKIIFDMEQETLDIREHDRRHDKDFVEKVVGKKVKVYKEDELKDEKKEIKQDEEETIEEKENKVKI